jgi:hypothetical protein
MKYPILIILLLLLAAFKTGDDVKTLLCHKWLQFALKRSTDLQPQMMGTDTEKECTFKKSGTYKETLAGDIPMATGTWFLSPDETKIGFAFTMINGQKIPPLPTAIKHYDITILRLTKDTLIYSKEVTAANGSLSGHDEFYFVKEN